MNKAITVIGVGDDGCRSLSSRAVNAVARCRLLIGGERHLEFFPEFDGEKIVLDKGIGEVLDRLADLSAEQNVCVLASGDPLFFGVGGLILNKVGAPHVEILPQPSSMQWAFAAAGLKWDDAGFISLHGRPREGFLTRLKRFSKVACFTDENNSPPSLASYMLEHGETNWRAFVCENLGGSTERVRTCTLTELRGLTDVSQLNVLILQRTNLDWCPPAGIPFLPDDSFVRRMPKKGLITKREVRALSIAALNLNPRSVVWDIGAGSGSISIESAMTAYEGLVYAVEVDGESVEICRENLKAFAVDNIRIIHGRAPAALDNLETPDAVFIGGSKGSMKEIIEVSLQRLRNGGRLVVNAITMENVAESYRTLRESGLIPEVLLVNIARGEPLAQYLRYEALNPIHILSATKNAQSLRP